MTGRSSGVTVTTRCLHFYVSGNIFSRSILIFAGRKWVRFMDGEVGCVTEGGEKHSRYPQMNIFAAVFS